MSEQVADCVILGAGLTGLSAAYHLKQTGKRILLLEKQEKVGGVIQTVKQDGFQMDLGANTTAITPLIQSLVKDLGLEKELLKAKQTANTRYLCRNQRLHKVYPSPKFLLSTKLLSTRGKWQLIREPWRKAAGSVKESVADFFIRRLGEEAYTYMLEPVLGGIYAGNPRHMSMEAVMPRLKTWESEHGSLFKGMIASRKEAKANGTPARTICSFQEGMQTLPLAIGRSLGSDLLCGAEVIGIHKEGRQYRIVYRRQEQEESVLTPQLIWALPAYRGAFLRNIDTALASALEAIPYVPMNMLYVAYRASDIGRARDGFGFLVPEKESHSLLGAIWNSAIFSGRVPKGHELFTLFVGGGRKIMHTEAERQETLKEAQQMFELLMDIQAPPVLRQTYTWQHAIPQYGLNHLEIRRQLREAEHRHPGLFLAGNFRAGVSVGDCLEAGKAVAEGISSN